MPNLVMRPPPEPNLDIHKFGEFIFACHTDDDTHDILHTDIGWHNPSGLSVRMRTSRICHCRTDLCDPVIGLASTLAAESELNR